jgi:hypothetical protein
MFVIPNFLALPSRSSSITSISIPSSSPASIDAAKFISARAPMTYYEPLAAVLEVTHNGLRSGATGQTMKAHYWDGEL